MNPAASVVLLSLDHWSFTETALTSLARTRDVEFETVVIDNGSAPAVVAALGDVARSRLGDRLRLRCHFNRENVGIASGRNQGALLAHAPLLVFLDNDVEIVDPSWLAMLLDALRHDQRLGVVGGTLLNADAEGTIQFSGGAADARGRIRFEKDSSPDRDPGALARPTTFCLGACMLTLRVLFQALGGFDTIFNPMDYEDVDYCLRAAEAGRQCAVAVRSRVVHHGHVTTGGRDFARVRTYLVNRRKFVRRWTDRPSVAGQRLSRLEVGS